MTEPLQINGVEIDATFAEAFDMKATRMILTAADRQWIDAAANEMTGFGTSVIACGIEIAVEQTLAADQTPDGREGVSILAFAVSSKEMEKQLVRRAGQCVLTCPTTALYAGIAETDPKSDKRIPIGKALRYFGDGHQISKQIDGRRFWRIPVMDGEFVCDHDVARVDGIGGGNLILFADSLEAATLASRAAVDAMRPIPGMITPFPGGITRSGSKVGSKYPALFASTNHRFCPSLRAMNRESMLRENESVGMEIVIDGLTEADIAAAMRAGILAACEAKTRGCLLRVTAGNYGGKLGRHHFHLAEVVR
ncbi:formylmethanofuran--tetrahydromethanopterin N-formyltransferase [Novipirellula artificiosorum]|uniref:Formylmethanofuran--tetrahydromethanopterin formyltransferase n=1 Tax=Novipirellula artificiosorum TaxID=2528016 RepID=A0A5C6E136_9BACT|nr:formylmethanofuran--tetrahydromethanopterin N-formyltransferase [Novipirellula artificiosorum]TWU41066.1 Formyltransferase/hydrolase complex subunit D [Novipirellula artificiosorum]